MKPLIKQNQVVTNSVCLAAAALAVVIGFSAASRPAATPEVKAVNSNIGQKVNIPVNAAQEIESIHDMLRRIAKANAADALSDTRKNVLEELQGNITNPLNSDELIIEPVEGVETDDLQLAADDDAARTLEATRQIVLGELKDRMQRVADNDAAQSLETTRQIVLEELKDNVNSQFYADLQYRQPVDIPEQDDQQVALTVYTDLLQAYEKEFNNNEKQR